MNVWMSLDSASSDPGALSASCRLQMLLVSCYFWMRPDDYELENPKRKVMMWTAASFP